LKLWEHNFAGLAMFSTAVRVPSDGKPATNELGALGKEIDNCGIGQIDADVDVR
jgi:hypothetical protein